jgi:alkanesulfonate monooxygenase SsuD/methylene tetrahydromethanopterin reductase-like flavin-dependent oxidoreductase (luciferase family)
VWHAWGTPAEFARKNAVLDRLCKDIGRPVGDLARASGGTVAVQSGRGVVPAVGEHDVQGTPEQVLSQLLAFRDAGADEFIVRDDAANVPTERALSEIDILTAAVLSGLPAG